MTLFRARYRVPVELRQPWVGKSDYDRFLSVVRADGAIGKGPVFDILKKLMRDLLVVSRRRCAPP